MDHHKQKDFIHHHSMVSVSLVREVVFGIEDGMVSTFGAIVGIATATHDPFLVILTGFVIISVESISMGVGSFLSSKSERAIQERKLQEEKIEVDTYIDFETKELVDLFVADGWPKKISKEMATVASKNKKLLLKEMAYRELKIFPDQLDSPAKNALAMLISYIVGGLIPLTSFVFLPVNTALAVSLPITLAALFGVGVYTTKFSKRNWFIAGTEMLALATIAGGIGYVVGQVVQRFA